MNETTRGNVWPWAVVALAIGLFVGYLVGENAASRSNPQTRALDANLWQHTSGEYRACCLQAYALARGRLAAKLKERKEGKDAKGTKKDAAVVMDLDETVLDNSAFETALYLQSVPYSEDLWRRWAAEYTSEVRDVPGAVDFIHYAQDHKVKVIYVSNRHISLLKPTLDVLRRLKVDGPNLEDRVKLATNGRDKTDRQKEASNKYDVLLWFGDSLRDFSEKFRADRVESGSVDDIKKAIAKRAEAVDAAKAHFGDDWIILPNPMYGEWTTFQGKRTVDVLRPSQMRR